MQDKQGRDKKNTMVKIDKYLSIFTQFLIKYKSIQFYIKNVVRRMSPRVRSKR